MISIYYLPALLSSVHSSTELCTWLHRSPKLISSITLLPTITFPQHYCISTDKWPYSAPNIFVTADWPLQSGNHLSKWTTTSRAPTTNVGLMKRSCSRPSRHAQSVPLAAAHRHILPPKPHNSSTIFMGSWRSLMFVLMPMMLR